jgi:F-type H+-transporting ATPase subunit a
VGLFISQAHAAEGHSPLEQFQINRLIPMEVGGVDVSFTNSALWMVLVIAGATLFLTLGMQRRSMVPGRLQSMAEMTYELVAGVVRDNVGSNGRPYFPFIFTIFIFVLFANLFGLIPYSFTVTSHIVVTFALAAMVWIGVTVIGIAKHGLHFFSLFLPKGIPIALAPLLVVIELISMMAGHTLIKVIAGFVVALGLFGVVPLVVTSAIYGLELLVAVLQAYVFAILTSLYLNDALNLH